MIQPYTTLPMKLKEEEVSQETTEEMEMAKVEEERKPGETKSQMSQGQVKGPTSQLLWTCFVHERFQRVGNLGMYEGFAQGSSGSKFPHESPIERL